MFAHITSLRYWKFEHDEETCEDACGEDASRGLFAVSDGAGTTLFSNIWANILVDYFLTIPLMSTDPFEVEWWVRQVQEQYRALAPETEKMAWNAVQKAQNQGSHATLATLRVTHISDVSVLADLLVFGDSCVLVGKPAAEQVFSFPLTNPADFDLAPICVPSKSSLFNRSFHRCTKTQVELAPDDLIVLATDAVSRWIISAGAGSYNQPWQALQAVVLQTPETWSTFITACRADQQMVDDDSTALILTLTQQTLPASILLGSTISHSRAVRQKRRDDFGHAVDAQNDELLALYFGDGADLALEGFHPLPELIQQAQAVADALKEMLQVLRRELNNPNGVVALKQAWQKHAALLQHAHCAENIRQTLASLGVATASSAPAPSPLVFVSTPQTAPAPVHQQPTFQEPTLQNTHPTDELSTLRNRLVAACKADDDAAIIAAYLAIQQSPYAQRITFKPHYKQCIERAQQNEEYRRLVHEALHSKHAEQMANVRRVAVEHSELFSYDEQEQLRLAHRFIDTYRINRDAALLAAFAEIQQSPYSDFIDFTPEEQERIAPLLRRSFDQSAPASSTPAASAPTMSATRFEQIKSVKRAYLLFKRQPQLSPQQLEAIAHDELADDELIREGVGEANKRLTFKLLNPEGKLSSVFSEFKRFHGPNYNTLLSSNQLTESEVREILLLFLRRELFEVYLRLQKKSTLYAWLEERRRERDTGQAAAHDDSGQQRPRKPSQKGSPHA